MIAVGRHCSWSILTLGLNRDCQMYNVILALEECYGLSRGRLGGPASIQESMFCDGDV